MATSRCVVFAEMIRECAELKETLQVDEKINDAYFAKPASKGPSSAEEEFFSEGKPKEKAAFPESKAADQKAVDAAVIAAVKKTENLA